MRKLPKSESLSNDSGLFESSHMSESIPLRRTLRIQLVHVIVGNVFRQGFDRVNEFLSMKGRLLWDGERQAAERRSEISIPVSEHPSGWKLT